MKNKLSGLLFLTFIFLSCTSKNTNLVAKEEIQNDVVIELSDDLCDKKAIDNAKILYGYLQKNYGKKVITGQMENAWNNDFNQLQKVYDKTNKYPALMGFDFIFYAGINTWRPTNIQTERAIKFWNGCDYNNNKISDNHGIVSFMWHWNAPSENRNKNGSFRPEETSFRIPYDTENDCWKTESDEYKKMIKDMDVVANELLKLQNENIPVLWRPFHEGCGNLYGNWNGACAWFWWGAGNSTTYNEATGKYTVSSDRENCSECYIALWKLMFSYFTETKGLHNLIWVWNGQNKEFYPGSDYVDIIGNDIYDKPDIHNSNIASFMSYKSINPDKIVALTECGSMPDIISQGALWSYFMVWNDSINGPDDGNFWNGNKQNSDEYKMQLYSSPRAITLEDLTDLKYR